MNVDHAAAQLAELGNPTRLRIVRLLVRAGHQGRTVGELQRRLGVPASTLSHHLAHLRHAALIEQRREGTVLRCLARLERLEALVGFLTAECCVEERAARSGEAA